MKKFNSIYLAISLMVVLFIGCSKELDVQPASDTNAKPNLKAITATFSENFDTGTKTAYTTGNVSLSTGSWTLNDALLGNTSSDKKVGAQSVRVRNIGKITMLFDKANGAGIVEIKHAIYGTDVASSWELYYSVNSGSTWTKVGSTITSTSTLSTASFTVNVAGSIRFEIRKISGGTARINIDDFQANDYATQSNTLSVSPTTLSVGAAASSTGTFNVTSNTSWTVASSQTWLTLSRTSGTGNLSVTVTASANTSTSSRTATVTVAASGVTSQYVTVTQAGTTPTAVKILFCAMKAESASNADWVIDADQFNLGWKPGAVVGGGTEANAQRYPNPAQSGITSTTSETYWKGGLSAWAVDCVKKGYTVETLPYNGAITYGNSSNSQDLSNYKIFVICEPNILFTSTEKTAIINFVNNGGRLVIIADHNISDRNGDGKDSPTILNDLMNNNGVKTNPFGIQFNLDNFSITTSYVLNSSTDPLLHGQYGDVTQAKWSAGCSMTLSTTANSTVKGIIFKTSSLATTTTLVAYATYGSGKVVAIGDSSVPDDGTGDTGDTLYNGYTGDANGNHKKLLMNAMVWLAN